MGKAYKKKCKTVRAGRQVRQIIYPVPCRSDPPKVRAGKMAASREAQRLLNRKYVYEKAQDLIAENFDVGDLFYTVTYDNEHYPSSRAAAEKNAVRLVAAIRKVWRSQGWADPVIFWVTEEKHHHDDPDMNGRLHHHLLIKAPPSKCYALLRSCWTKGRVKDIEKLRVDKERNYETIARYLCKEAPEVGKHQYHITRNAGRPDVDIRWVDGDAMIKPPKGSLIFATRGSHDYQHGAAYQYAYFILPLRKRAPRR